MRSIIEFFIKRSLLVNILLVGIFLGAIFTAFNIKRNAYPEVDLATLVITTEYPGASPKDVEQNVTRLIEDELKGIAGIEKFTSVSSENVSTVVVEIDVDYPDPDEVKDEVRRAVDRVNDLPDEVEKRPHISDLKSTEFPIMIVGVAGEADYRLLRKMAKSILRDLRNIRGVAKVDEYAFRDQEFQVEVMPEKLDALHVAINDVLYSIENRNVRSTGGSLESFRTQRNILTLSEFEKIEDLKNVVVRASFGGGSLKLSDVANVKEGFEEEKMRTIINGQRGISFVVKKSANSDLMTLVDRINDYVEQKQKVMPVGVKITTVNDGSIVVRNRLNIVRNNAILGFVLVIGVLIVFLNFRSSFWIAMSIPAAFSVSLILIPWFGVDLNAITLSAMILVLGMLVDDSIVVAENIFSHRKNKPSFQAALDGTMEVITPVVATMLTTILAFAPMLAMEGVMGRFVYVIPVTIIAALMGSLLDCFCVLPNHLYHSTANFNSSDEGWRGRFFEGISKPYRAALRFALKTRYLMVFFAILVMGFSVYWAKEKVGFDLFPTTGAQVFYVYLELDKDKTFQATEEVFTKVEKVIQGIPKGELEYYYGKIGTDTTDSLAEPVGGEEHLAYIQVTLVPFSERGRDIDEIMAEMRDKTADISGLKNIRYEIEKDGPPGGKPIELHVHSDNDKQRKFFVDRIVADLEAMENISDIDTTDKKGRDEYKLNLDYDKLAAANLTVKDVAATLRVAFDGIDATSLVRDNEEIKIRVRFPTKNRENVQDVLNLKIRNNNGSLVPIWSFATLGTIEADSAIHHKDGDVTTTITAQTSGGAKPSQVINQLITKYSPELKDYPEISFSYGGEAEKTEESMRSLFVAFAGGAIAIYLILIITFNSLSQPLLILISVPFGLIGVIWTFYFHGIPFSFLGLIGVVGLSGVVINASLIMVDFINTIMLEKFPEGNKHSRDLYNAVVDGAKRRLRPIIISTTTTVMGLLPTAYGIGGFDPFIAPMVLAVAYGLIFGTSLTLFLIPCLYLINNDFNLFFKSVSAKIKHGFSKSTENLPSR